MRTCPAGRLDGRAAARLEDEMARQQGADHAAGGGAAEGALGPVDGPGLHAVAVHGHGPRYAARDLRRSGP